MRSSDPEAIEGEFRAAGLEPLAPYTRAVDERPCRCMRCGTRRWVRLRVLRRGGIACRWCHGWAKWEPWAEQARARALRHGRALGAPEESLRRIGTRNLAPITPVGDLYTPVGVVCLACGETTVQVPERIRDERRAWYGCGRCAVEHDRAVRADAEEMFAAHGLRLLDRLSGEYVPQRAECLTCGSERPVSYSDLRDGTAPLCWTCTHGIRPDEPHRVYLIHFPALRVMKVGITHNRHDRRLLDHALVGGRVVQSVVVTDRAAARRLERLLVARYAPWSTADVGPDEFPQGGWTETWREDAPLLDLTTEAQAAGVADSV